MKVSWVYVLFPDERTEAGSPGTYGIPNDLRRGRPLSFGSFVLLKTDDKFSSIGIKM